MRLTKPRTSTSILLALAVTGATWGAVSFATSDERVALSLDEARTTHAAGRTDTAVESLRGEGPSREVPATATPYSAAFGSVFRGVLRSEHGYRMRANGQASVSKISVVVRLRLRVVQRDGEQIRVAASFEDAEVNAGHTPHARAFEAHARAALQGSTEIAMNLRGAYEGFRFAPTIDGWQRNFVRSMLAPLSFPLRAEGESSSEARRWKERFAAPLGVFRAEYALSADRCSVKRELTALIESGPQIEENAVRELRSEGNAVHDAQIAWVSKIVSERSIDVALPIEGTGIVHVQTISLELEAGPMDRRDYVDDLRPWASVAGHLDDGSAFVDALEREARLARFANKSFLQSIHDLRDLIVQGREKNGGASSAIYGAWREITERIGDDPRFVTEIEGLLRGGVDRDLAVALLAALAKEGSERAQGLMVSLFEDPSARVDASDIAIALGRVGEPLPSVLNALEKRARSAGSDLVGGASLLSLGSLSARKRLLAMRTGMERAGALGLWIEAIGNSASPENLDVLAPLAKHRDARVRAAAASALRSVENASGDRTLIGLLHKDPSLGVKSESIASLAGRAHVAKVRSGLRSFVVGDAEVGLRRQALAVLARASWSERERLWLTQLASGSGDLATDARSLLR